MADPHDGKPFPVVTIPPDEAADYRGVVEYLLRRLVLPGGVDPATVTGLAGRVHQRERLGSTAIGRGIAIPHCQVEGVSSTAGVIGKSEAGIDWPGAADDQPVHVVCLVVSPKKPLAEFCRDMEQLVQQLRSENP